MAVGEDINRKEAVEVTQLIYHALTLYIDETLDHF